METKNPIQVADKLFLVLETLAKTGPIGLSELCREVNLNKTTVHRILNSLLYLGYVRQDEQTSYYSLSFKIWDIANQLLTKIDLVEEARPLLKELASKTGETVHLVQIDGIHAIYIAKEESENSVRLVSMVGKRIPLYCSGVGKALLADMPDDEIRQIWEKSDRRALTEHTITDYNTFMEEIRAIRQNGYATDNEENELGVRCIAASITQKNQPPRYAFSVSAPIHRMDDARMAEIAGYALAMKERLGY
ncbi:MAG: IclR family transcriptional regulator [Eubacterium sp.]|nr:IclR family transcriptional regulator [Eubacterium sp.]